MMKIYLEVGTKLNVTHFKTDQYVDVTSKSIGKGFAGAMKRHNLVDYAHLMEFRYPIDHMDLLGKTKTLGEFLKEKMAGRMGARKVTKQNLKIIDIDQNNNLLIVKGSVQEKKKKNSVVFLKDSVKKNSNEKTNI